jgi:hypothetical protein
VSAEPAFAFPPTSTPSPLIKVLDDVRKQVETYVECNGNEAIAITLWIAYTHAIPSHGAPPFDVVPYLFISSAEKQSGKSTLLNVMKPIAARGQNIQGPTMAVFIRLMADRPSLMFDEVDTVFTDATASESQNALRQALNTGFHISANYPRYNVATRAAEYFSTFGAKAMAGIGRSVPETVMDRSIHVTLRRREVNGTRGKRARIARLEKEGGLLNVALATALAGISLRQFDDNDFPPELSDRGCDIWEPLLSLAEAAGEPWKTLARDAALALDGVGSGASMSRGQELLRDLRDTVFPTFVSDFIPTKDVIGHPEELGYSATGLCAVDDGPWASYGRTNKPITAHALRNLLRPYGVPVVSNGTARGMKKTDLDDVFKRYLTD